MDLDLLDKLIERVADWRTWAALWFGVLSFYLWRHSADFMTILKQWVPNSDCTKQLAAMRVDVEKCNERHDELQQARLDDAAEYNLKIGRMEAQIADLVKRTAGLSNAFVVARHGEHHVSPPAD